MKKSRVTESHIQGCSVYGGGTVKSRFVFWKKVPEVQGREITL